KTICDLNYLAYSRICLNTLLIATGDPLPELQRAVVHALSFAQKAKIGFATDMANLQLCLIRTLRGLTTNFGSFEHAEFDEIGFERRLESYPPAAHWGYWVRKLQAHFFAGDFASAIEASLKARPLLATLPNFAPAEYEFYSALAVQGSAIPQRRAKAGSITMLSKLTTNSSKYGRKTARRISETAPLWWGRKLRASRAVPSTPKN